MRKHFLFCILTIVSLFLTACSEKEQEITVQSIAISQPSAELKIGEMLNLKATVSPSNATYDGITWTSTRTTVATVSGSGLVSALAEGNTTITAMAGGKTASCSVTVVKGVVAVSSISLNKDSIELVEGDSETLTATVSPSDATDKTVSWSSSNTGVATVKDGTITAVKEGEATITAKAGEKTASCKVVVAKKVIPVESIILDKDALELIIGESATLIATVKPDDATDKSVYWSSSDESIASVGNSGIVSAKAAGEAFVTAKAGDKSVSCAIYVKNDPKEEAIVFADSKLKACLVSAFDTNKDGELSYNEASSVTSENDLKNAFRGITTFISFDEFQYFIGITSVPSSMCQGWSRLESITLPSSVRSLDISVFGGCSSLTRINIPEGIPSIPRSAFSGCTSLSSITLPESITIIAPSAFGGCTSLASIIIPEAVTSIGDRAFQQCTDLTSIVIPQNVSRIGKYAFSGCSTLSSLTIMDGVSIIDENAFECCMALTAVTIPGSVTKIGNGAFYLCRDLKSIALSDGVSEIEDSAFRETNLSSITIPKSVIHIGKNPFCFTSISSIIIEQGNLVYDTQSKSNAIIELSSGTLICGSQNTVIPDYVSSIGASAFQGNTGLTSLTIPEGVTSIGAGAFWGCSNLSSITMPKALAGDIQKYTFLECSSLASIVIPEGVTRIEESAFEDCSSLSNLVFPESLTHINKRSFLNCINLKQIAFPNNVVSIGDQAFSKCSSISSIILPASVQYIGESAFRDCSHVTEIRVMAIIPPVIPFDNYYQKSFTFSNTGSCPINVPSESVDDYKAASGWITYADRIQAISQ